MTLHATITDAKALSEVPYDRLVAFLEREGFEFLRLVDSDSAVYNKTHRFVFVYRHQDGIHATGLDITLANLSIASNRSQLDIYADIMGFQWAKVFWPEPVPKALITEEDSSNG